MPLLAWANVSCKAIVMLTDGFQNKYSLQGLKKPSLRISNCHNIRYGLTLQTAMGEFAVWSVFSGLVLFGRIQKGSQPINTVH